MKCWERLPVIHISAVANRSFDKRPVESVQKRIVLQDAEVKFEEVSPSQYLQPLFIQPTHIVGYFLHIADELWLSDMLWTVVKIAAPQMYHRKKYMMEMSEQEKSLKTGYIAFGYFMKKQTFVLKQRYCIIHGLADADL